MELVGVYKKNKYYLRGVGGEEQQAPISSIADYLLNCKDDKTIIYIKNLRLSGESIITELQKKRYKRIRKKKEKIESSYYIKQNAKGVVYEITIYQTKKKHLTLKNIDSILLTQKCMSKEQELKELEQIVQKLHGIGCKNTSLASFGFTAWTRTLNTHYRAYFPPITEEIDGDIRQAYNHGIYYFNRRYLYKKINNGVSLDINSMYPFILKNKPLPMDKPIKYNGEYSYDVLHPLFIQEFYLSLTPKSGKIDYLENDYLTSSPIQRLCLSSVALETLKKFYDVKIFKHGHGYKFKSCRYLFDKFVKKWYWIKVYCGVGEDVSRECFTENYEIPEGMVTPDPIMAKFSKIVLNTLVGQFGRKPYTITKTPHLKNGHIEYTEERKKTWSIYLPLAVFVVDYGRQMILEMAQKVKDYSLKKYGEDRYIYTDTDCIRTTLPLEDLHELFDISPTELGKFKVEEKWDSAYFCGIKSYVTKLNGKINFHVAGLENHEHEKWLQENEVKL